MSIARIIGIILLVIGIVCLVFGFNSSRTVVDKLVEATTGRYTQSTMWYIMGGIAMVIGGLALWVGGRPKP